MRNPSVDWCCKTEPDPGLTGRSLEWPRGKVLGGSLSLNGLLYVRGQPTDYDRWRQMGTAGWGWDDAPPLFKRAEANERGADEFHGDNGPLSVSNMRIRRPIVDAWGVSARAVGRRFNPDCNGATQEGLGCFQLATRNGRRCSAAVARLNPVLSAGAIGSPQILMLSGVGEAAQLQANGVAVVHDLPGVGKNLQDHLQARLVCKCNEPTLNDEVRSMVAQVRIALKYALFRAGPMTMAASLATGFVKTAPHLDTPDIQLHVQPWSADSPGEGGRPFSAFTVSVCQLRPESRGEIRLAGPDPKACPKIQPNYPPTQTDCRTLVAGVNVARKIAALAPLTSKISQEFRLGKDLSTDDYDGTPDWARSNSSSIHHPTGARRMGAEKGAVVYARLRVHGIRGLRVADCSIMPEIVSGNTNAPAIMIGEKAGDLILEDRAKPI